MDAVSGGGKDEPSNHELSENQATGEAENSRLKAKVRELEEENKVLLSKIQVEKNKVERIKKDKSAKERRVQGHIEEMKNALRKLIDSLTDCMDNEERALKEESASQEACTELRETITRLKNQCALDKEVLQRRFQEVEANDASAQEREKSVNEQLSQTLSQINVLKAQISCFVAEEAQLFKALEKETQRAAVNRQDYLEAKDKSDTSAGRANQLEEELRDLKNKYGQELQELLEHRQLLEHELVHGKTARLELERTVSVNSTNEKGVMHKLPTAGSISNSEESFSLEAVLDSPSHLLEMRNSGETNMSSHYLKTVALSSSVRQKDDELSFCKSRLVAMESIRDTLAEELLEMTKQCEKLRIEADALPGIRTELADLSERHAAALELMGEQEKELEELRADMTVLTEVHKEHVDILITENQVLRTQQPRQ